MNRKPVVFSQRRLLGWLSLLLWGGYATAGDLTSYDGVVEAERQAQMAAQVSGTVMEIRVHPGDRVKAGQVLLRLDDQQAHQASAAGSAQVQAAQATLTEASQEEHRQQQLFAQGYISQAALDRAEARFHSAQAVAQAQQAQASESRTAAGYYVLRAPFDGVVADIPAHVGDMAQPGRLLLNFYDPAHLRVTTQLPQSVAATVDNQRTRLELVAGQIPEQWVKPASLTVLPTVDPLSHTVEVRLGLAGQNLPRPGTFVRVWLPGSGAANILRVPLSAVVQRAEMTGVYVRDSQGRALLRQVRLGRVMGSEVQVLTGIGAQDVVISDAQTAANMAR